MVEPGRLRVAAIADIHVQDDQPNRYLDLFAEIAKRADVLALAGDLTDLGKPSEATVLANSLRGFPIPVLAVLGNHDYECGHVDDLKQILRAAGIHVLEGQTFEVAGVGFVGTKGFGGGFGRHMLGSFGEPVIKQFVAEAMSEAMRLENGLRSLRNERVFVILHYAPVADTVAGESPEILPFLGSSRLAETIDRFKVDAVVHGHAHVGRYEGRTPGGVPVYNVASHVEKPSGRPYALIEV